MVKTSEISRFFIKKNLPLCLALFLFALLSINNNQKNIKQLNKTSNQLLFNEISRIIEFQELALKIDEEVLEKKLKHYSFQLTNKYLLNVSLIKELDLREIQENLKMNPALIDIFIINNEGTVVNTTSSNNLSLNFFNLNEDHKYYIPKVFKNKEFKCDKYTFEKETKRLKKYSYQLSNNGKYIIILGGYSYKADEITDLIINHINLLAKEINMIYKFNGINSVDLIIDAENPFLLSKKSLVIKNLEPELKKVFENKLSEELNFTEKGQDFQLNYTYLNLPNNKFYSEVVIRTISEFDFKKKNTQFILVKIAFLFGVLLIIIISFNNVKNSITKPIDNLIGIIKKITKGDYSVRVPAEKNNGYTELFRQFNLMIDNFDIENEGLKKQNENNNLQNQQLIKVNNELEKRSLVASKTNNAVSIFNKEGVLEWVNDGFEKLFGYTLNEVFYNIGENIIDISENKDIDKYVKICIQTKQPIDFETEPVTKKGKNIWIQTTLSPYLNKKNEVEGIIAIDTNITTLKIIEEKLITVNKEIYDSISYAKKIQDAIMISEEKIKSKFPDAFVLLKPKSIVSGDFYWFTNIGDEIIIAAADCTGHGIPGAFMSIMGNLLLNKIIIDNKIHDPAEILFQLRKNLGEILLLQEDNPISKDGIDIALCKFNMKSYSLEFSGSYNPLYIVSKNKLIIEEESLKSKFESGDNILYELKADRYPYGLLDAKNIFNTNRVKLNKGDRFYLFTDGFSDQFGGENNKKYKYINFKNLILEIQDSKLSKQKSLLESNFKDWKRHYEQVDDLLIVGIEI